MRAVFFTDAAEFRAWLLKHRATATKLVIGFYKKAAGKTGMTYKEAVDEALCFGWIDGILRRIDEERYCLRFTPRKTGSIWSNVNVANVARLTKAKRMHASGLAAFAARPADKTGIYLFEAKKPPVLPAEYRRTFQAAADGWTFFRAQPPGYQRNTIGWVMAAKQATTRERRLRQLIEASGAGRRIV